jgi:hypothetical protein
MFYSRVSSLLELTPEGLTMRNPSVFSGACGAELAGDLIHKDKKTPSERVTYRSSPRESY